MLHVLLPAQYLRRPHDGATPHRRLMIAVLQTALDDCQGLARAAGAERDRLEFRRAMAFFESQDRSWPFSFVNICDAIGLDADGVRRVVSARMSAAG